MASRPETTINPEEARHFGALAADWWNPKGSSAMLHKLNPVRLRYIRAAMNAHWGIDAREMRPLEGNARRCGVRRDCVRAAGGWVRR
jgi:2-polyprenyl-6-hydroxyphenyl methylase/3-demethylubiquinone-9 3-methyltransferase